MLVLATYNFKGGVGKTATAVTVAHLAARDGLRVLLWDLDPQGAATFTFRIKQKVKGGTDKLFGKSGLHPGIRASDFEGLDVLASDLSYRHLDVLLQEGKDDALKERLEPLEDEYDLVVLDCAPTLSAVTENVFTASDVILAPTIPTALSLRTLARFMKHLKKRGGKRPRVLPFFCMVDRRKSLHVRTCDWAHQENLGFLKTEVPYSSAVEQMSVRRSPLAEFAKSDRATRAYEDLWAEVRSRLEEQRRSPSKKDLDALYEHALQRKKRQVGGREIEFKLRLDGASELEAVAAAAERRGARRSHPVEQENHFYDTPEAALRSQGLVVRLRREDERFVLAVKGARIESGDDKVHVRPEEEAVVSETEGQAILKAGQIELAWVAAQLGAAGPLIFARLGEVAGTGALNHVGSFRNRRMRVGPLEGMLTLELDRTELPGGRVDHELELEVEASDRPAAERLLEQLLADAEVSGVPATSKAKRFFEALGSKGRGGSRRISAGDGAPFWLW